MCSGIFTLKYDDGTIATVRSNGGFEKLSSTMNISSSTVGKMLYINTQIDLYDTKEMYGNVSEYHLESLAS